MKKLLINRYTGERLELPDQTAGERSLWLFKRRIRAFDGLIQDKGLSVSFLTITQSDDLLDGSRWITGLMQTIKKAIERSGGKIYYVAALEIQPRRYKKYGVIAPHWHVAVACSSPGLLPHGHRLENGHVEKEREGKVITWDWLYKNIRQKFGMYFVCDCWSHQVFDYLGKYLAKGDQLLDLIRSTGKRVRVFSSSRFPVRYQMTYDQKREYDDLILEDPDLADLYTRCEGSQIVLRGKEVIEHEWENGYVFRKVLYPKIRSIQGAWIIDQPGDTDRSVPLGESGVSSERS